MYLEHKLIILGLDNAGKTTILYQLYVNCKLVTCLFKTNYNLYNSLMEEVVHTSPTLGSNVEEVVWKNIHFVMWDIGGQDTLRQSWSTYYSNTEVFSICIIFVVDLY